ncbi:arginine--tRNA ligase domain-containing protein, partial [Acinetobacter baumannii]|uniref:arginine--tRNA ligase domain-containing protein n=1 Tax=Acinetobacter baumannii TaxID=470 RepID=UPI0009A9BA57
VYNGHSKACQNDPERMQFARKVTAALQAGHVGYRLLWEKLRSISLSKQLKDMELLNAHFDLFLGESDVQPLIPEMIQSLRSKGIAKESQGALIIDVSEETDKEPFPPLMLEQSDGNALNASTDLDSVLDRY